ncbi:hypothetical protein G5I_05179 [Acromyrmex echinatior]|uniref:Uncharacterized protein n=1 Tax=Acromyrmex echinatior TaxID=103372 RepID=F4WHL6_ACREC|nr:hypothetical protein G5I_05179 [Acromyrmex echinatior]
MQDAPASRSWTSGEHTPRRARMENGDLRYRTYALHDATDVCVRNVTRVRITLPVDHRTCPYIEDKKEGVEEGEELISQLLLDSMAVLRITTP